MDVRQQRLSRGDGLIRDIRDEPCVRAELGHGQLQEAQLAIKLLKLQCARER